jgi:hypothetical protein
VTQALGGGEDGAASRFLYAWPMPQVDARLRGGSAGPASVHGLLRRLADLPATMEAPHALCFDEEAVGYLETVLPTLRTFMRDTDGLESAWIGKGAGNIVRLAGLLCLMTWAEQETVPAPVTVGQRHVEQAHALWAGHFWPHAQAVFGQAGPTLAHRRTRRIATWLRRLGPGAVSREEIRREALCQTVDADTVEDLIERLERHGVLRPLPVKSGSGRGPRKRRWEVNPELWAN